MTCRAAVGQGMSCTLLWDFTGWLHAHEDTHALLRLFPSNAGSTMLLHQCAPGCSGVLQRLDCPARVKGSMVTLWFEDCSPYMLRSTFTQPHLSLLGQWENVIAATDSTGLI